VVVTFSYSAHWGNRINLPRMTTFLGQPGALECFFTLLPEQVDSPPVFFSSPPPPILNPGRQGLLLSDSSLPPVPPLRQLNSLQKLQILRPHPTPGCFPIGFPAIFKVL